MDFTILDLFSGAGGLTEGFIRAGFYPIAHVEMDQYAFKTLQTRIAYHFLRKEKDMETYLNYLYKEISRDEFLSKVKYHMMNVKFINAKIDEKSQTTIVKSIKKETGVYKVNVVVGGPPCQTFSYISRHRRNRAFMNDDRTYLFKRYLYFIRNFKPDIFVFENVTGILNAADGYVLNEFIKMAEKEGYALSAQILNAKDFGVLQNRRRVIFIGWIKKYNITESSFIFSSNQGTHNGYIVWDVLKDLPPLQPGEGTDLPQEYSGPPSDYLVKYHLRADKDVLTLHRARTHNERDREIYRIAINLWTREQRRLKYHELPKRLKTHKNQKYFVDRFKVVAGDLPCSQTITAHLAKDGHYYIHPDINQARSLTVREAARLQSFPDNYFFEGPRTSQFIQVGNAVPPLMAEVIALKIRKLLEEI